VYDAPVFDRPIEVTSGMVVERDGFVFADVAAATPSASAPLR